VSETFQQRYCRHFGISPERFASSLLSRTLYPRVWLLRPLLWLCDRNYFAADKNFVGGVGRLTQRSEFYTELKDFQFDPENRGFLRGAVRLRISANRMSRLFFQVWPNESPSASAPANPSGSPFPATDGAAPSTAPGESA
jgi:hypothetical protein